MSQGAALVRSLNSWEAFIAEQAVQRRCLQRLVAHVTVAAFDRWVDVVGSDAERRARMRAVVGRLMLGKVSSAFDSWVVRAETRQHEQTRLRMVLVSIVRLQ